MKFVSFTHAGRTSYGISQAAGILDIGARFGSVLPTLKAYLEAAALGLAAPLPKASAADFRLDEVKLAPVIPDPGKILCVGLNYEEHRQETGRAKSAYPAIFTRFADSLIAHGDAILRPPVSAALDYEGELAVVIGQGGYRIPKEKALASVAGYACFNDATLRDWQRHTHQFTPGKTFPATGPFGPEMVTPDEIEDFPGARIETRLNGQVMQSAELGDMIFPVEEVIAYVSAFTPLKAGDVIAMGTPGGVGFKREPQVFMQPGDSIEVIIAGVGHLANSIADEIPGAAGGE